MLGIDKDRATTEPELSDADSDLKKLRLSLTPVPNWGKVTLTVPTTLRVWENAKKRSLVTTRSWDLAVPSEKTAFEALTVTGVWLEGIETGVGDLELKYEEICRDKVRINVVNLDLDVDNDTQLGGADDGVARYLPGYKGANAVLSTGTTFLNPAYQGQAMTIVLDGIGTNAGFDEIVFTISGSSSKTGFCENATDAKISGTGKEDDFSFQEIGDKTTNTVTSASAGSDGKIESNRTWSRLWCKDYGGSCKIKVFLKKGGVVKCELEPLVVPLDEDKDGLSDIYEKRQLVEWKVQYNLAYFDTNKLDHFHAAFEQPADQDGIGTGRPALAADGDGLTAAQEYRGYILDGGVNNFAGGHKRLTFARKNLLVEVMEMPGITDVANNNANTNAQTYTLPSALAPVCDLYRHDTIGAAVEVYWVWHPITDFGDTVTYSNGTVRAQAYYYHGDLTNIVTHVNIKGDMWVGADYKLLGEDPQEYDNIYGDRNDAIAFGGARQNHDPKNIGFLACMVLTRYGTIMRIGPPRITDENARANWDSADPRDWSCRVAVNSISEEQYGDPGVNYDATGFMNVLRFCIAHELGHLIIGTQNTAPWEKNHMPGIGPLMGAVPQPAGLTVIDIRDAEIGTMNLANRAFVR